jgi:hypothetical protein
MEVPVELMKGQLEKAGPGVKLLAKSLADGMKQIRTQLKNFRMDLDNSPMPQTFIPKMFSMLVLVADHAGKKLEDGTVELSWGALKIYVTRMFLESHVRMRGVLDLLQKLDLCEMRFETNDDGERELIDFVIKDMQTVEDFCEFYQYNLFKGGKAEVIYVDPTAMKVTQAMLYCAQGVELDRRGSVQLGYEDMLKTVKKIFKFDLKTLHLDSLEKKGLFVKRQTRDEGTLVSFDVAEFKKTYLFWKIIHQIDRWNQTGIVDPNEPVEQSISEGAEEGCPSCGGDIVEAANFCPNCGHRLVVDGAA